jgi:hypothetical protein
VIQQPHRDIPPSPPLPSPPSSQIADDLSHTLTRAAPIFGGIKSLRTTIARYIPMPLARINRNELYGGLPWDPALGAPPSDTTIVGTRAVYTAIGTNSIMVISKLAAFGVTGSASILSEAVHSIADLVSTRKSAPVHSILFLAMTTWLPFCSKHSRLCLHTPIALVLHEVGLHSTVVDTEASECHNSRKYT